MSRVLIILVLLAASHAARLRGKERRQTVSSECEQNADIIFVIDSSVSAGRTGYQNEVQFVRNVVNQFEINPTRVQVGVMSYGSTVYPDFFMDEFSTRNDVLRRMLTLQYRDGVAVTPEAIRFTAQTAFLSIHGGRANALKIMVLVTTSQSAHLRAAVLEADRARDEGIFVYVVGVGSAISENELKKIANDPDHRYYLHAEDTAALGTLEGILSERLCSEQAGNVLSPTTTTASCLHQADVAFLVDSSGSVGRQNFTKVMDFVEDLVQAMEIGVDQIHVGVTTYQSRPLPQFDLIAYMNKSTLLQAIETIDYNPGGTNTPAGIDFLRTEIFDLSRGARTGVPRIAIIITDGRSRRTAQTITATDLLRGENIATFAVGVGNNIDDRELNAIGGDQSHVFRVGNFADLSLLKEQILQATCTATSVTATPAPTPDPGVTLPVDSCQDTLADCGNYGQNVCVDFRAWAETRCQRFCGFCTPLYVPPAPCADQEPDCTHYARSICSDSPSWAATHCNLTCGFCDVTEMSVGFHGKCFYQNTMYNVGERWDDGCDYECVCQDGDKGRFQCYNKCPVYHNLPADCTLVRADSECCLKPVCNFNQSFSTVMGSGRSNVNGIDVCEHNGKQFYQGQTWRDGCEFSCTCEDASRGVFRCQSLCPIYNSLPSYCKLEIQPGECCAQPRCEFDTQYGHFIGFGTVSLAGTGGERNPVNAGPCVDGWSDCHLYDLASCNDPTHDRWANTACRKYCGRCGGQHPAITATDQCVHDGTYYSQGDTWNIGCDTICQCEDGYYGYYTCKNLCPQYSNLPDGCSLRNDTECCARVFCSSGTFISSTNNYWSIAGGGQISVQPVGGDVINIPPTPPTGQVLPPGMGGTGFVAPTLAGCLYKGSYYVHDQRWEDGCQRNCICEDGSIGLIRCAERCAEYRQLPSQCSLTIDPQDACCMVPTCAAGTNYTAIPSISTGTIHTSAVKPPDASSLFNQYSTISYITQTGGAINVTLPTPNPFGNNSGIGYCELDGQRYLHGVTWDVACDLRCICEDASTGRYVCRARCPTYGNLPDSCSLIPDPRDSCCQTFHCTFRPSVVTVTGSGHSLQPTPSGSVCQYNGQSYSAGQVWYDGCDFKCACFNPVGSGDYSYKCVSRCASFHTVPTECTFVEDPVDPACCTVPRCPISVYNMTGEVIIPTSVPTSFTASPSGGGGGGGGGSVNIGYCAYGDDQHYRQGEVWEVGCQYYCECVDERTGNYRCQERCPRYHDLPDGCTLTSDFADTCCQKPTCNFNANAGQITGSGTVTTEQAGMCVYENQRYAEGETWHVNCEQTCRCDDADQGFYTCRNRCPTYTDVPDQCHFVTSTVDACCLEPKCNFTAIYNAANGSMNVNLIPTAASVVIEGNGYQTANGSTQVNIGLCVYKNGRYLQGDTWQDGCDYTCECLDATDGSYRCVERCAQYLDLPAQCRLMRDPANPCCNTPRCDFSPNTGIVTGTGAASMGYSFTPTQPALPDDVCVYGSDRYTQGQSWYDGCDYVCQCEDASQGLYRCNDRCKQYGTLPSNCSLVSDPNDPLCCQVPKCVFTPMLGELVGYLPIPTAAPGEFTGGSISQTTVFPNVVGTNAAGDPIYATAATRRDVCVYNGVEYQQGQRWSVGCDYSCECYDADSGRFRCTERCPQYVGLPDECTLVQDVYDPCCKKPYCDFTPTYGGLTGTGAVPTSTASAEPMCVYHSALYKQGEEWNDGCDLHCRCEDATAQIYRCTDRCATYPSLPATCVLHTDPRDGCCQIPSCLAVPTATPYTGTGEPPVPTEYPVPTAVTGIRQGTGVDPNNPVQDDCFVNGQHYAEGESWEVGCLETCVCINATAATYHCSERCPQFLNIPDYCQLVVDPDDSCCRKPQCFAPVPSDGPPTPVPTGDSTPHPTSGSQPARDDVCMYDGVAYTQGQQWYVGCDKVCICEDSVADIYRCSDRCSQYTSIPPNCHMVADPQDPGCCVVPQCIPTTGPQTTGPDGSTQGPHIITDIPTGSITGIGRVSPAPSTSAGQTPDPNVPITASPVVPSGCIYDNVRYDEGQRWQDGCEYNCICEDGVTGQFRCDDRCPKIPVLPPNCQLRRDYNDLCCYMAVCDPGLRIPSPTPYIAPTPVPGETFDPNAPTPTPQVPAHAYCMYNGVPYRQGASWDIGCESQCICEDPVNNDYRCFDRCASYPDRPATGCVSLTDPEDSCCQIIRCHQPTPTPDINGTVNPTPIIHPTSVPGTITGDIQRIDPNTGRQQNIGYCLYDNTQYQQGDTWEDGCNYRCECEDTFTGHYSCVERCPKYPDIPSYCVMVQDPNDQCCLTPSCPGRQPTPTPEVINGTTRQQTPVPTGVITTPQPLLDDVCTVDGVAYTEGQRFTVGCEQNCVCEDGQTGRVTCTQRCPSYDDSDPNCILVPDPRDPMCCKVPQCDSPTDPGVPTPTPTGVRGSITGATPPPYRIPSPSPTPAIPPFKTPYPGETFAPYLGMTPIPGQTPGVGLTYPPHYTYPIQPPALTPGRYQTFEPGKTYSPGYTFPTPPHGMTYAPVPGLTPGPNDTPGPGQTYSPGYTFPTRPAPTTKPDVPPFVTPYQGQTYAPILGQTPPPGETPLPDVTYPPFYTYPTSPKPLTPGPNETPTPGQTYAPGYTHPIPPYGQTFAPMPGQTPPPGATIAPGTTYPPNYTFPVRPSATPAVPPFPTPIGPGATYAPMPGMTPGPGATPGVGSTYAPGYTFPTQPSPFTPGPWQTPTPGQTYAPGYTFPTPYQGDTYAPSSGMTPPPGNTPRPGVSYPPGYTFPTQPPKPGPVPTLPFSTRYPGETYATALGVTPSLGQTPAPGQTYPRNYTFATLPAPYTAVPGQTPAPGMTYPANHTFQTPYPGHTYAPRPGITPGQHQTPEQGKTYPPGYVFPTAPVPTPTPAVPPFPTPYRGQTFAPELGITPPPGETPAPRKTYPPGYTYPTQPPNYTPPPGATPAKGETYAPGYTYPTPPHGFTYAHIPGITPGPNDTPGPGLTFTPGYTFPTKPPRVTLAIPPFVTPPLGQTFAPDNMIVTPRPGQTQIGGGTYRPGYTFPVSPKPFTPGRFQTPSLGETYPPGYTFPTPIHGQTYAPVEGLTPRRGATPFPGLTYSPGYTFPTQPPKMPQIPPVVTPYRGQTYAPRPGMTPPAGETPAPGLTYPVGYTYPTPPQPFTPGPGQTIAPGVTYPPAYTFPTPPHGETYAPRPGMTPAPGVTPGPGQTFVPGYTYPTAPPTPQATPYRIPTPVVGLTYPAGLFSTPDGLVTTTNPARMDDYCEYNGRMYQTGQKWMDGCDYTCECLPDQTYRCLDRCERFPNLAPNCRLVYDPMDPCCQKPQCTPAPATTQPGDTVSLGPANDEFCVINGVKFYEGQQWEDGCAQVCRCEDASTNTINCDERCHTYPVIPSGCTLVTDPDDDCCRVPQCPPQPGPNNSTTITGVPGSFVGQARPNPNSNPMVQGRGDVCIYDGVAYQQGETWEDGCLYTCECIDENKGQYRCVDKCLQYAAIPSTCSWMTDPADSCCRLAYCSPSYVTPVPTPDTGTGIPIPTSSTPPSLLDDVCIYNGDYYQQDQVWYDGCGLTCKCEDADTNSYRCEERCARYGDLPVNCTLIPDPKDPTCCLVAQCGLPQPGDPLPNPSIIQVTGQIGSIVGVGKPPTDPAVPGSSHGCYFNGIVYARGQNWQNGCDTVCECLDDSTGQYQCLQRCPHYGSLPLQCRLVRDPSDDCCYVAMCDYENPTPFPTGIPIPVPQGYPTPDPNRTPVPVSGQAPVNPTPTPPFTVPAGSQHEGYCVDNGVYYLKGQQWNINCDSVCRCEDPASGRVICTDRCPAYDNSAGCRLRTDPQDSCCLVPDCSDTVVPLPNATLVSGSTPKPIMVTLTGVTAAYTGVRRPHGPGSIQTGSRDVCVYDGRVYNQSEEWDVGCNLRCECLDAKTGQYRCLDRCLRYVYLPPQCTMVADPNDSCCEIAQCDISYIPTPSPHIVTPTPSPAPPPDKCVFSDGRQFSQGEQWNDGCAATCMCVDTLTNQYTCDSRCPVYSDLPDYCTLVSDPTDTCCKTPECRTSTGDLISPLVGGGPTVSPTLDPSISNVIPLGTHQVVTGVGRVTFTRPDGTVGYRDGCLYNSSVYEQDMTWTDGCNTVCRCEDASTGQYRCIDKCPRYPSLPSSCRLTAVPGVCCPSLQCNDPNYGIYRPIPEIPGVPTANPDSQLIGTGTSGTSSGQTPYPGGGAPIPSGVGVTGISDQCVFNNRLYNQGETWEDGCQQTCECLDGRSGYYQCTPMCATYTNMPSECRLISIPGQCCQEPVCRLPNGTEVNALTSNIFSVVGSLPGVTTGFRPGYNPSGTGAQRGVCVYNMQIYTQGQTWTDGCEFECECTNAQTGMYSCRSRCPQYTYMPSMCRLLDPATGECCQQLQCNQTTDAPGVCEDRIPNCADYGDAVCQAPNLEFGRRNCSKFCGFCSVGCVDKLDNCQSYDPDVCQTHELWARDNCARYCNYCGTTEITTEPTSTQIVVRDCSDHFTNCSRYDADVCTNFAGWSLMNCPATCNLCANLTALPAITDTCFDLDDNCMMNWPTNCRDERYRPWLQEHCNRTCSLCEDDVTPDYTPTPTPAEGECQDRFPNCTMYSDDACTMTKGWAIMNCALRCNLCADLATLPPITESCFDVLDDCLMHWPTTCQDTMYRPWLQANCNRSCNLCGTSGETVAVTVAVTGTTATTRADWTVMMKGVAGVPDDLYELWFSSRTANENIPQAAQLTTAYAGHYKPALVNYWSQLGIQRVKVSMMRNGQEVAYVIFNGQGSNKYDWFTPSNIIESSYSDIQSLRRDFFSMEGDSSTGRRFMMNSRMNNCDGAGWMMISTQRGCTWETGGQSPMFLYSPNSELTSWSLTTPRADLFVISAIGTNLNQGITGTTSFTGLTTGCIHNGTLYNQGDWWSIGCEQNCTCENAAQRLYRCYQMCPTYDMSTMPANCVVDPAPPGECCPVLNCAGGQGCLYNGRVFQQDETWDIGCEQKCTCVNSVEGRSECRAKCVTWPSDLPSGCILSPSPAGKCCEVLTCPPGVVINYPPGYGPGE